MVHGARAGDAVAPAPGAVRIVFPAPNRVALEAFDPGGVGDGAVSVRSVCSLMSPGTEATVLHRRFSPGTGWAAWGRMPFHPGYAVIGIVERVGQAAGTLAVGDRVAIRRGHASHHVVAAEACYPVPAAVPSESAAWFALAWIAFRGVQAASIPLGDEVLVVGAGPVGQMVVRWCRVAGAGRIGVVDPILSRLGHATRGGASFVIDGRIDDVGPALRDAFAAASTIIDTTGNAAVFETLLRNARPFGRIVLLGDTGHPERQHLTQDVILKGLTIVGAHDGHERDGWTGSRVTGLFLGLLAAGRFAVDGLITHRFSPQGASAAYELAGDPRAETLGVVFDWTGG